jgi:hypothetical protein
VKKYLILTNIRRNKREILVVLPKLSVPIGSATVRYGVEWLMPSPFSYKSHHPHATEFTNEKASAQA